MGTSKIEKAMAENKIKIAIVGMGYVGLPLAVEFAKAKIKTAGFEVDAKKAASINKGESYIPDVPSKTVKELSKKNLLSAETDFSKLKNFDAIIICVPTPLRKSKDPDASYIISASKEIAKVLRKGQIVILESTTYPGTTKELVKPLLEESGLKAGKDFLLAFSPERVDPGNKKYFIKNTPKVIGGINKKSTQAGAKIYGKVAETVIPVSNTETAEIVKLLENTFRAVNIAMINEFALMADKLNLDIWEIISAAASKPFGFMPFYPGPGIGGHCIPLDPHYLAWKMKTLNFEPRFIELAGAINSSMPEHVVNKIAELLNTKKKALNSSKILMVGIAYKPDITDDRESPAKDVFALLEKKKAKVEYYDPFVPHIFLGGKKRESVSFEPANIKKFDCAVIITPHSSVNYEKLLRHSKMIFDTRNALKKFSSRKISRL